LYKDYQPSGCEGLQGEYVFYNLGQVMEEIQLLLDAEYLFDWNPLVHLRKYFPDFKWQSHARPTEKYREIICGADYIWRSGGRGFGSGSRKYITATERGVAEHRRICFSPKSFEATPLYPWPLHPFWVTETQALILVPTDKEITLWGSVNAVTRKLVRKESPDESIHEAEDILATRGIVPSLH